MTGPFKTLFCQPLLCLRCFSLPLHILSVCVAVPTSLLCVWDFKAQVDLPGSSTYSFLMAHQSVWPQGLPTVIISVFTLSGLHLNVLAFSIFLFSYHPNLGFPPSGNPSGINTHPHTFSAVNVTNQVWFSLLPPFSFLGQICALLWSYLRHYPFLTTIFLFSPLKLSLTTLP